MKKVCLLAAILLLPFLARTQNSYESSGDYTNAIGLRAGDNSGITFKHLRDDNSALELILSGFYNDLAFFALYEKHYDISNVDGLRYYIGVGGHVAFDTYSKMYYMDRYGRYGWVRTRTGFGVGIDGIAGLEYKIPPIPLSVSLDLKPYIEVNSDGHVYVSPDPGLSLRVAF